MHTSRLPQLLPSRRKILRAKAALEAKQIGKKVGNGQVGRGGSRKGTLVSRFVVELRRIQEWQQHRPTTSRVPKVIRSGAGYLAPGTKISFARAPAPNWPPHILAYAAPVQQALLGCTQTYPVVRYTPQIAVLPVPSVVSHPEIEFLTYVSPLTLIQRWVVFFLQQMKRPSLLRNKVHSTEPSPSFPHTKNKSVQSGSLVIV